MLPILPCNEAGTQLQTVRRRSNVSAVN